MAQTTATIVGTVTDSSGAIVPKTKVIAVHNATGLTRAAETNQSGNYVLPLLPVGEYGITAEIADELRSLLESRHRCHASPRSAHARPATASAPGCWSAARSGSCTRRAPARSSRR